MKTALATLKSVTPVSFSRRYDHEVPLLEGETKAAYDDRTWRHRAYSNADGEVILPAIWFKKSLDWTAAEIGLRIAGRGTKTWSKPFAAGVICLDDIPTGIKLDDVKGVKLPCNSEGRRGGKLDVFRTFPVIPEWEGVVTFAVLNDTIDETVFKLHLVKSGQLCGIGRWAPRNAGMNGRFEVVDVAWQDEAREAALGSVTAKRTDASRG